MAGGQHLPDPNRSPAQAEVGTGNDTAGNLQRTPGAQMNTLARRHRPRDMQPLGCAHRHGPRGEQRPRCHRTATADNAQIAPRLDDRRAHPVPPGQLHGFPRHEGITDGQDTPAGGQIGPATRATFGKGKAPSRTQAQVTIRHHPPGAEEVTGSVDAQASARLHPVRQHQAARHDASVSHHRHIATENSPAGNQIEGARRHPIGDVQGLARMQVHQPTGGQAAGGVNVRHSIHREVSPHGHVATQPHRTTCGKTGIAAHRDGPRRRQVACDRQVQVAADLDIAPTVAQHQRAGVDLRFAGRHPGRQAHLVCADAGASAHRQRREDLDRVGCGQTGRPGHRTGRVHADPPPGMDGQVAAARRGPLHVQIAGGIKGDGLTRHQLAHAEIACAPDHQPLAVCQQGPGHAHTDALVGGHDADLAAAHGAKGRAVDGKAAEGHGGRRCRAQVVELPRLLGHPPGPRQHGDAGKLGVEVVGPHRPVQLNGSAHQLDLADRPFQALSFDTHLPADHIEANPRGAGEAGR